jgi:hypothetical protein
MATIHGYHPARFVATTERALVITLCGEPVNALADMREKVTDDVLAINCGRCLTSSLLHMTPEGTPVQRDEGTAGPVAWADTYRTHVSNMNGPIEPPAGGPWELVTAAVVPFGNDGMVDVVHFWRRRNG